MTTDRGRICARCDEPILPGEEFDTIAKFSPSGVGGPVDRHLTCPVTPPPRQTAPAGWTARR